MDALGYFADSIVELFEILEFGAGHVRRTGLYGRCHYQLIEQSTKLHNLCGRHWAPVHGSGIVHPAEKLAVKFIKDPRNPMKLTSKSTASAAMRAFRMSTPRFLI